METGETQTSGAKQRPAFESEFKQLPLDEKLGSLFRMEAAAIEETITVVADASMKVFNKAAEALDEFGNKMSAEFRKERGQATGEAAAADPAKPKGAKKKNAKPGKGPEVNV